MRLLAWLLPLFVLAVVGGFIATAQLRDAGAPSVPSVFRGQVSNDGTPASQGAPHLKPGASVCQGILHQRDSKEARVFPDVYTQRREVMGLTVVGGPKVDPKAFDIAQQTIERMFEHNDLIGALQDQGAYVVIMEAGQGVLDLPEFACLEQQYGDDFFNHVCGIADHADYPVATVSELDLLGKRDGPCRGVNVLFHEMGHLVQSYAMGPADYFDVKYDFQEAMQAGKYRRQYANTNANEYFAEGTLAYFHHVDPTGGKDRGWLEQYDPALYKLLTRVYGE